MGLPVAIAIIVIAREVVQARYAITKAATAREKTKVLEAELLVKDAQLMLAFEKVEQLTFKVQGVEAAALKLAGELVLARNGATQAEARAQMAEDKLRLIKERYSLP